MAAADTVPPNIGSHEPADLASTLRLAWRQRGLDVRTIADVTRPTAPPAPRIAGWGGGPGCPRPTAPPAPRIAASRAARPGRVRITAQPPPKPGPTVRNPGSSMITEDPRHMEPQILRDHGLILVG
jgi:hypothetical protein